jgi:hypothetical protein
MTDRMDQIITAAVRQGFNVRQTRTGTWMFSKGIATMIFECTPRTSHEWMRMINTLRGAGLRFPRKSEED